MDLNLIRNKIDEIDDQMLELFSRRMELALNVAEYKKENHLPVLNQGREDEILGRITKTAPENLSPYAYTLFSTLFALSRAYQEELLQDDSLDQSLKGGFHEA